MRSEDLSIQVKQTIVRLQKQNKSITEIAGTLGVAKSRFHTFWEKKECTGRPRRTTVVDDRRILSMVKENPFTTSSQEKNTLQEVDVSLSMSTIKRRLHQSKYRGYTTRCKQGQIRLSILWMAEIKINLYQNDGKKKVWRRLGTAHDPKHTTSSVKHDGAVWSWAAWLPMALGYWCLVMTWQKTEADGWTLKCIEIYCLPRFSQHSTNGRWTKTYSKSNPGVLEGKKVEYSAMAKSISWSQLDWAAFHSLKTKLKAERATNKQQLKSAAVKAWQTSQKRKPCLRWCPWVPDLRQSLPAKDSQQNIKNEHFIYDYIYSGGTQSRN